MYNFFANNKRQENNYFITDSDHNHIFNVLRMKIGDEFLISDNGTSNLCRIVSFSENLTTAEIVQENFQSTELPIEINLFQGLPKSDKLELIIQKTVELGVFSITPTEMSRCVTKIDEKKKTSKISRWQAISESAAKQSKRNIIPQINNIVNFKQALDIAKDFDLMLLPYESKNGMTHTKIALDLIKPGMKVAVFIGPEGGFDEKEILLATESGAKIISLGKRILRTETAAISTVAMCMLHCELTFEG